MTTKPSPPQAGVPEPTEAMIVAGAKAIEEWMPGRPNARAAAVGAWHDMWQAQAPTGQSGEVEGLEYQVEQLYAKLFLGELDARGVIRAALRAQGTGEPVGWQFRYKLGDWINASSADVEAILAHKGEEGWACYELRPTYAAPVSQPPNGQETEPLPPEQMCPNCVTPWKCNGPHIPPGQQSPPTVPGWLLIYSAPRDGTKVLLAKIGNNEVGKDLRIWWAVAGYWSAKWNNWNDGVEPCGLAGPTHWMPMPPPPAVRGRVTLGFDDMPTMQPDGSLVPPAGEK